MPSRLIQDVKSCNFKLKIEEIRKNNDKKYGPTKIWPIYVLSLHLILSSHGLCPKSAHTVSLLYFLLLHSNAKTRITLCD